MKKGNEDGQWSTAKPRGMEHTDGRIKIVFTPSIHIPLLIEIGKQGLSILHFCAKVGILQATFWVWIDKYDDFSEGYQTYKIWVKIYWECVARDNLDNPNFNYVLFKTLTRITRADVDSLCIRGLAAKKSATKRIGLILEHISEGSITGRDAKLAAEVVAIGVDVQERTDMFAIVEDLKKLNEIK